MTQRQIIRMLYRGGQAAILAEVIVALGVALIALVNRDVVRMHTFDSDSFYRFESFLEASLEHRTMYTLSIALSFSVPTVVMFAVIWALHHYFAHEGVILINWVATSIALSGATLMLLMVGLDIMVTPSLADEIVAGNLSYREAFPALSLINSTFNFGTALLYGLYPIALAVASYEKRLLPNWFVVPVVAVALMNDAFLLSGGEMEMASSLMGIGIVLWPFLMGVVMLTKARTLAVQLYEQTHGSPPPQPAPWRLPHLSTPATTKETVPTPDLSTTAEARQHP